MIGEPEKQVVITAIADEEVIAQPAHVAGYTIVEALRLSGAESCYLASDPRLDRQVVLKTAFGLTAHDFVERWRQGTRQTATLREPGVAAILDVGSGDGCAFLAREFVPGKPLSALLPQGGWTAIDAVEFICRLADLLSSLHRRGVAHGNLKDSNVIVRHDDRGQPTGDLVLVDFRGGEQATVMAGDVRAVGHLLHQMLSVAVFPAASGGNGAGIMWLVETCRQAIDFPGPATPHAMQQFATHLRSWLAAATGRRTGSMDGALQQIRSLLLYAAAGMLLLLSFWLTILSIAEVVLYGWSHLGPMMQNWTMMVAPILVCGVLLWKAAGRSRQARQVQLGLVVRGTPVVPAEISDSARSGLATTEWIASATASKPRATQSAVDQLHLLLGQTPPELNVRIRNSGTELEIRRTVGSATGTAMAILAMTLAGVGLAGLTVVACSFGSLLALSLAGFGAVAIVTTLSLTLWIIHRFAIEPVSARPAASMKRRLRFPVWLGTETLLLGGQQLTCQPASPRLGRPRDLPWSEVWDIKEGDRPRGLEIATLRLPIRFGAGSNDAVRGWVTRVLRLWKQAAQAAPGAAAQLPEGAVTQACHELPRLEPDFCIRRVALPGALSVRMAMCGVVLFPLLAAAMLALQPWFPPAFPAGSPYLVLQWGLDTSGAIVSVVSAGLLALGIVRLRRLERSGLALIRAGFWLRVALLAFLYFAIWSLQAAGVRMTTDISQELVEVAPAVSVETFLSAISNLAAILLICWVETRSSQLPLHDD
jgi:hypothetical protein